MWGQKREGDLSVHLYSGSLQIAHVSGTLAQGSFDVQY